MPLSIAQVAQQKQAKLFRRGVDWSFSIDGDHWHCGVVQISSLKTSHPLIFP